MTLKAVTNAKVHILDPKYLYVYRQSIVFFWDCTEVIRSRKESESYILFHLKKNSLSSWDSTELITFQMHCSLVYDKLK